jgi:hypothetical protein
MNLKKGFKFFVYRTNSIFTNYHIIKYLLIYFQLINNNLPIILIKVFYHQFINLNFILFMEYFMYILNN